MSALEPEPDPGPLPDYVVDPEAPPRERVEPKPAPRPAPILGIEPERVAEPDPSQPLIAGLGIAPLPDIQSLVKESGQDRAEPGSERSSKEPRPRPAPVSSRKGRRERSAEDPGDEAEAVNWMDGLSSRLSAYSLADDGPAPASQDEPAKPDDTEDEEVV